MKDLYGDEVKIEFIHLGKTFEEKYIDYINSAKWKRLRIAKLEHEGWRCEKCGISRYSAKLQVHHKTYERFKHERLEDLKVLCPKCHELEDLERKGRKEEKYINKKMNSALIRGFENWMDAGNNARWRNWDDNYLESSWNRFIEYLGFDYKPKYWRSPNW